MRAFFYALVAAVLLALTAGAGWLWHDSAQTTTQLLVRSGGSRALLVSVDRGRLALMMARGPRLAFDLQFIQGTSDPGMLLDEVCDSHFLGFGYDKLVRQDGLVDFEAQAVLQGSETRSWRASRLVLPMWSVVAILAVLFVVWWWWFNVPLYRELRGRCRRCANDIRSSSHYCPLCKHPLPRRTWSGPVQGASRVGRR